MVLLPSQFIVLNLTKRALSMNYFRYKQFNNDVITIAVGFNNILLFCMKFERKGIKSHSLMDKILKLKSY